MKGYCNKCGNIIEDMNSLEIEEFENEGSFVCSTCINEEMLIFSSVNDIKEKDEWEYENDN